MEEEEETGREGGEGGRRSREDMLNRRRSHFPCQPRRRRTLCSALVVRSAIGHPKEPDCSLNPEVA